MMTNHNTPAQSPAQFPAPPSRPLGGPAGPPVKTGPRVGLVIWGLVVALLGLWIVITASGFTIDGQLALIVILGLGGLSLIATALISSFRHAKR
ncbi:MAG: hypothetical protein LBG60_17565 [Bifidobacteriaceae bacterium]|jgi:hypothetical protein|nr:hypothetical protein [Bifidobacteriaceae bacterium]